MTTEAQLSKITSKPPLIPVIFTPATIINGLLIKFEVAKNDQIDPQTTEI